MTLILNEIHLLDGIKNTRIISAADRRFTVPNSNASKTSGYIYGPKIFKIEHLNATVSFWGYAYVKEEGIYKKLFNWLPAFINKSSEIKTLKEFANVLKDRLNSIVPKEEFKKHASGYHFCGYNSDNLPEFYHFSNCEYYDNEYRNIRDCFGDVLDDFLGRDAIKIGWDGQNKESVTVKNMMQIYRNGDIAAHCITWNALDDLFKNLFKLPNFKWKNENLDYEKYMEYKLKFINSIYNHWAKEKWVGGKFDIIVLQPQKSKQNSQLSLNENNVGPSLTSSTISNIIITKQ